MMTAYHRSFPSFIRSSTPSLRLQNAHKFHMASNISYINLNIIQPQISLYGLTVADGGAACTAAVPGASSYDNTVTSTIDDCSGAVVEKISGTISSVIRDCFTP